MKDPIMEKLTPNQRALAAAILAEVIARPSFQVAMLWVERSGLQRAARGYPTSVGMICLCVEHTWGAVVGRQVMALALENSGFTVAGRSFGPGMAYELATNVRRRSINSTPWRTEQPRPERWLWAADAAPVPGVETLYKNLKARP